MSDIFLSYTHNDADRAKQLVVAFIDQGWSVWWDHDIPVGKDFSRVIRDELTAAKCVIVLWSEAAAQSDWVLGEVTEARRSGVLFPVRLDTTRFPIDWSQIQYADLSNWSGDTSDALFLYLQKAVGTLLGATSDARTKSAGWPAGMPHLTEGLPLTKQVLGYSGRWRVKSSFSRWRGRPVGPGESVAFNGTTYLGLQSDGKTGSGMQIGVLTASLKCGYTETRYIGNEIISASAEKQDGSLTLTIQVKHRSLSQPPQGAPPADLGMDLLENLPTSIPFVVELKPVSGKPKYLEGGHMYNPTELPYQVAAEYWNYLDF